MPKTASPERIASAADICPHCGHGRIRIVGTDKVAVWFSCNKCNASGPVKPTIAEAREAWNMRYKPEEEHVAASS